MFSHILLDSGGDSPPPMYDYIIPRTVTEVWEGSEGSEMKENEVYGLEQRGNIS